MPPRLLLFLLLASSLLVLLTASSSIDGAGNKTKTKSALTQTITADASATISVSDDDSLSASHSVSISPTPDDSASGTQSLSQSRSVTDDVTLSVSTTPDHSASASPTDDDSASVSVTGDASASFSITYDKSVSFTRTLQSFTPTISGSPSDPLSETFSSSHSDFGSLSETVSADDTQSFTITPISKTKSRATRSPSDDESASRTPGSETRTRQLTVVSRSSLSRSGSDPSETSTRSPTVTADASMSASPTDDDSATRTPGTESMSPLLTESASVSVTNSSSLSASDSAGTPSISTDPSISASETAPSPTDDETRTVPSLSESVTIHPTSTTAERSDSHSPDASMTFTFSADVSATASRSLEPTATVTHQVFPPWASALEDASVGIASASVVAGIVASVVGGASPLSVLAAQRVNMLATFRRCRAPDPDYRLSILESPTQLSIGDAQPGGRDAGAALGNTLIIGGVALLLFLVAKWKTVSKDRNLAESLNNIYFPSLLSCVALALWQPLIAGAAGGMAFGDGAAQIIVGVLIFLAALAVWVLLFFWTLFRQFRPAFVWKRLQQDQAEKRGGLLKKGDWDPFFWFLIEKPIPKPPRRQGPANPLEVMADAISYRVGEWRVEEKVLRGVHKPSYIRDLPSVQRGSRPLAAVMAPPPLAVGGARPAAAADSNESDEHHSPPSAIVSSASQENEKQPQQYDLTRREYFWWRNAHDAFFFFVTDRARWFLVAEWCVSLFFGILSVISRKLSCTVAGGLLFLPLLVYLVLLLWLRPFAVNFDNVTLAALAVLMMASLIFVLLAINVTGADAFPNYNPSSRWVSTNEAVLLVIGILILLRALSDLFRVARTLWRDRQKAKWDAEEKARKAAADEEMKRRQDEACQLARLENPLIDPSGIHDALARGVMDSAVAAELPEEVRQQYQELIDLGELDEQTAEQLMAQQCEKMRSGDATADDLLDELHEMSSGGGGRRPLRDRRLQRHAAPPPPSAQAVPVYDANAEVLDVDLDDDENENGGRKRSEHGDGDAEERSGDDNDEYYDSDFDDVVDGAEHHRSAPGARLARLKNAAHRLGAHSSPHSFAAAVVAARRLQRGNPDDELAVDEQDLAAVGQKVKAAYARDLARARKEAERRRAELDDDAYAKHSPVAGSGSNRGKRGGPSRPKPIDPAVLYRSGNMAAVLPDQSRKVREPKKIDDVVRATSFLWVPPSSSSSSRSSSSSSSSSNGSVLSVNVNDGDDDGSSKTPSSKPPKQAVSTSASPNSKPTAAAAAAAAAAAVPAVPPTTTAKRTPPSEPIQPPPQAEKFQEPKRVVPAAAAAAAAGKGGGATDPFIVAILSAHNALRAQHGAPPLEWSAECAEFAAKCANECATKKAMTHCHNDGPSGAHGQNISWASDKNTAEQAVKMWYAELAKPGYDFKKSDKQAQPGTGHFTQVVWMGTRQVGAALSPDGKYLVCNYFPSGNMAGTYATNVKPPGAAPAAAASAASPHRSPTRGPTARRPTPPEDQSPATAPSTPPERVLSTAAAVAKKSSAKMPNQDHGIALEDLETL